MRLRLRLGLTSLLIALPAALLVTSGVERWRARDLTLAVERVVRSQINDQVRERCESDPTWFFTGPLHGRPRRGDPPISPDALPPRPRPIEQPFELFPYDDELTGSSSASPRLPEEFRRALRRSKELVSAPFVTAEGTGAQVAAWTGWAGPCAVFLGRMRPPPGPTAARLTLFGSLVAIFAGVAFLASAETVWRARRLADRVETSARTQHPPIVPDIKRDEIGTIAFAYNDAVNAIRLRLADIGDRDDAFTRYLQSGARVIADLSAVEVRLGAAGLTLPAHSRDDFAAAIGELHALTSRLETLAAAARLRGRGDPIAREPVDLGAIASAVVSRIQPIAGVMTLTIDTDLPKHPVVVTGDAPLFERALAALVGNAVRFGRPGGSVRVTLEPRDAGRAFSLRVTDTGRGVSDQELKGLAAIRRFRGDEDRVDDAGVPRLGLAVAREVAERAGFQMTVRKPAAGGLEVEWTGPVAGPA